MAAYKAYDPEVLKHLQQTELEILLAVDKVCRENDIVYWLDSGTALGAVRHKGFIPWDDDADIGMLRPDYDRFMTIAPHELGERYAVSGPRSNPKQSGFFGKVWLRNTIFETPETKGAGFSQGIFVDVFPYDVLNKDPIIAKKQIVIGNTWQKISYLYHSGNISAVGNGVRGSILRAICLVAHFLLKPFVNQDMIIRHFDKAIQLGKDDPSDDYVGLSYPMVNPFPKKMLIPPKRIEFEGAMLPVPNETIAFLEKDYGPTWNELPPIEQRRNHAPMTLKFENG